MIIETSKNTAFTLVVPMVSVANPETFLTGEVANNLADTAFERDDGDAADTWTALPIADTFTEIGTTGVYNITLTAAEMNHDWVFIKVTSDNAADTFITIRLGSGPLKDIRDIDQSTVH